MNQGPECYLLSLPERVGRVLAAVLGGLIYELTELALPRAVRRSRLYQAVVYRLLRLAVELVGGVPGVFPAEEMAVGELAMRKGVGNVIELASFLAVGWSPLWLLAAASDLSGGTRAYLKAFAAELQKEGLLQDAAGIQSVDELLQALESSSGLLADLVDVPPLKAGDLRASWQALAGLARAGKLPDPGQLSRLYEEMQQVAQEQGRPLGELSRLLAAGAMRAGMQLGSAHVFDYYREALERIREEGWSAYALRTARPYARAALGHFDPRRHTYTERLLRRRRK
jgi:hypothetical protein